MAAHERYTQAAHRKGADVNDRLARAAAMLREAATLMLARGMRPECRMGNFGDCPMDGPVCVRCAVAAARAHLAGVGPRVPDADMADAMTTAWEIVEAFRLHAVAMPGADAHHVVYRLSQECWRVYRALNHPNAAPAE